VQLWLDARISVTSWTDIASNAPGGAGFDCKTRINRLSGL
jgi:hypothetical protein